MAGDIPYIRPLRRGGDGRIDTASILTIFVGVFIAHNLEDRLLHGRHQYPIWLQDRYAALRRWSEAHSKAADSTSTWRRYLKLDNSSRTSSLNDNDQLTMHYLTFRYIDWPPRTKEASIPFVGHIFAHFSFGHLACNGIAFASLASSLLSSRTFGSGRFLVTFLAGGLGATALDCTVNEALASKRYPRLNELVPVQPDFDRYKNAHHLGASGALCCLATISAIAQPWMRWGILFIPYGMPARLLIGGLAGFDAIGWVQGWNDGIGHSAHLGGNVMGVALWLLWFRRSPWGVLNRKIAQGI